MNTQPKPTTPNDIFGAMPDFPEIEEPKPTGKWTVETVSRLMPGLQGALACRAIAVAHNASITAEREKTSAWKRSAEGMKLGNENYARENQQLREKLAEDRENTSLATQMAQIESQRANEAEQKAQTLVDALKLIACDGPLVDYRTIARTALVKVKK